MEMQFRVPNEAISSDACGGVSMTVACEFWKQSTPLSSLETKAEHEEISRVSMVQLLCKPFEPSMSRTAIVVIQDYEFEL